MNLAETLSVLQAATDNTVRDHFSATGNGFRCHACGKMFASEKSAAAHLTKTHAAKLTTKKRNKLEDHQFAWVDPKTGKRKLPINDAKHVKAALARFNQTKEIPQGKRAAVASKIARAAKRFGIDPSGFEKEHGLKAAKGEYIVPPRGAKKLAARKLKKPLKTQDNLGRPSPMTMPQGGPLLAAAEENFAVGALAPFAVRERAAERY